MESQCGHDSMQYTLVATVVLDGRIPAAGWMYCPECDWHGTWALSTFNSKELLDSIGPWSEELRTAMRRPPNTEELQAIHDLAEGPWDAFHD